MFRIVAKWIQLSPISLASDGGDLEYVVDPIQQNPPVLQYDVENDTFEQVAETLIEFVVALETSETKSS